MEGRESVRKRAAGEILGSQGDARRGRRPRLVLLFFSNHGYHSGESWKEIGRVFGRGEGFSEKTVRGRKWGERGHWKSGAGDSGWSFYFCSTKESLSSKSQ